MLPQELYDEVLDHLVGQVRTLVTCALVCKRWLLRCRYHIYRKVHLRTRRQLGLFYRSLNTDVSLCKIVASVSVHNPMPSPHTRYTGDDDLDLDIVSVLLVSILPNLDALLIASHGTESRILHMGQITFRCVRSLRMLSKLVLHNLHFATLAALGRFVAAFPSLKILRCTDVAVVSHGHEHLVQALTPHRLEELNVNSTNHMGQDVKILSFLLRLFHGHLRHLTVSAGDIAGRTKLLPPLIRLPSLEVRFDRPNFSFGRQETEIIRSLVEKTLPEALQVVFEGCGALPVLSDGRARTKEELRRLDALLMSLPGRRVVTFVLPHGAQNRRTFWQTTFHDCFVGLRTRGCLNVTYAKPSGNLESPEEDGLVHASPRKTVALGHSVASLAVSLDSKWVASGSSNGLIMIWDPDDTTILGQWACVDVGIVWHLAFSPDSQRLVCSGSDGRIVVWNVEQGDKIGALTGHTDAVRKVVWSPDGTRLASGSDDSTVRVWDAETYLQLYVLETHTAIVLSVAFAPDSNLLASCSRDHHCYVWHVETGTLKHDLSGHQDIVWTAVFAPDSSRIATASDDRSVRIWSVETGEELVVLQEHRGRVWVVAFTEDGKQIMSASSDSTVKVSDSFSGERILVLKGHNYKVNDVQFSPDGKYIASASSDKTVRLWNRSDGSCAAIFSEHNDKVTHVVFSPDGRTLTSAGHDGMVYIRRLSDFV